MKTFQKVSEIQEFIVKRSNGRFSSMAAKALRNTRVKLSNKEDKCSYDEFQSWLEETFECKVKRLEVGKEDGKSGSGKFPSFEVCIELKGMQSLANITLAYGANNGELYEQEIVNKLKENSEWSKKVFDKLGINWEDIDDITFDGSVNTSRKRFLDLDNGIDNIDPEEFGRVISDVTIISLKNGENIYLSIKNKLGCLLYNSGASNIIVVRDNKLKYINPDNNASCDILNSIVSKLDWSRVENGFNDYVHKTNKQEFKVWLPYILSEEEIFKFRNLIECSWGIGYWYFKEDDSEDGFYLEPILTKEHIKKKSSFNIESSMIKYPSKNNKTFTFRVFYNIDNETSGYYDILFRNNRGLIIPNILQVKRYLFKNK